MPADRRPASPPPRLGGGRRRPRHPGAPTTAIGLDPLAWDGLPDPFDAMVLITAVDPLERLATMTDLELDAAGRHRVELDRLARELQDCYAAQRSHGERLSVMTAQVEDLWDAHWRAVGHTEVLESEIRDLRRLQAKVLAAIRTAATDDDQQRVRLRHLAADHVSVDRSNTTTARIVGALRCVVSRLSRPSALGQP